MKKRQKDLLIYLLEASDFVSAAYLSKTLGVSAKTIYQDLKDLEALLLSYQLLFVKVPRHGIFIEGKLIDKNRLLVALRQEKRGDQTDKDYRERQALYLKQLIIASENGSVLDFSLSFYLSETSVRRDLEKLEELLSPYHLRLQKAHGEISIRGSEKSIRQFYRSYLISNYQLELDLNNGQDILSDIFGADLVHKVYQIMKESTALYAFSMPSHLEIYLILDLLMASCRIGQKHFLEAIDSDLEEDLHHFEVYPFASQLLSKVLEVPLELVPANDIKQICLTILSLGYITLPYKNKDFHRLTLHLISKVGELSGIDFTKDKDLYEKIANHMRPMIYRLKNGIELENQTTEEIKKRYSILFNIVWLASKTISDSYAIAFLDSEIAFLTIYFQIAVEKIAKPVAIYVICPHGLATSELIINSLRRLVSPYDNIKKIEFGQVSHQKLKKADIIVSSVELETIDHPYILVSPVMSQTDIDTIRESYHRLVEGNRKTLSVINHYDYVHHSLVRHLIGDRVYLHKDCQTTCDSITYLVEQNPSKENHEPTFLESIFKREKLGSTSVYTGIAIPHASPDAVQESQLSLLTLKEPIPWGKNMVKVVMLIAIKEGEEDVYKDALIYIYSKIDHQDFIDQLAKARNQAEFMTILLGEVTNNE